LKFLKLSFAFILTKIDKVKSFQARELAQKLGEEFATEVILTSARKREGRRELINYIEKKIKR
ncbi:MAG: hypothetical protein J7L62_02095, partial [Candidatus Aminicenantes bacterium]|nr:hypothetical protein [Candidatus Aminicenantes bacterium]